jgi:hypothetical protein
VDARPIDSTRVRRERWNGCPGGQCPSSPAAVSLDPSRVSLAQAMNGLEGRNDMYIGIGTLLVIIILIILLA